MIGILGCKKGWYVQSNQESGRGYSDITVKVERENLGIVIEVKYAENGRLDSVCRDALQQIEEKDYADKLWKDGYRKILKYGIACYKKECRVMVGEQENTSL